MSRTLQHLCLLPQSLGHNLALINHSL
jgi:hypothetical protein